VADADRILEANAGDMKAAEGRLSEGLLDRLKLNDDRIRGMAEGIRNTAALEDPVGVVLDRFDRPSGISVTKVSVPLGVVGIIYEARPNVTADAFAIGYKSGNAVILKGGSDAVRSCSAIADSIRAAIRDAGEDPDVLQLIEDTDRSVTGEFMHLDKYVDVMIPRGSARLIAAVKEGCSIPVIETGSGNCHIFVDRSADIDRSIEVIINAKTQRTGCATQWNRWWCTGILHPLSCRRFGKPCRKTMWRSGQTGRQGPLFLSLRRPPPMISARNIWR
jgi:glutamate-5-semialdehyde dehydrogenase